MPRKLQAALVWLLLCSLALLLSWRARTDERFSLCAPGAGAGASTGGGGGGGGGGNNNSETGGRPSPIEGDPKALALLSARLELLRAVAPVLMTVAVLCACSVPLSLLSCCFLFAQGAFWRRLASDPAQVARDAARPRSAFDCCGPVRLGGTLDIMRLVAGLGIAAALLEIVVIQSASWIFFLNTLAWQWQRLRGTTSTCGSYGPCCTAVCLVNGVPSGIETKNVGFAIWLNFAAGQSLTCSFVGVCLSVLSLRLVASLSHTVENLRRAAAATWPKQQQQQPQQLTDASVGVGDWPDASRVEQLERAVRELSAARDEVSGSCECDRDGCCCGARRTAWKLVCLISVPGFILVTISVIGAAIAMGVVNH